MLRCVKLAAKIAIAAGSGTLTSQAHSLKKQSSLRTVAGVSQVVLVIRLGYRLLAQWLFFPVHYESCCLPTFLSAPPSVPPSLSPSFFWFKEVVFCSILILAYSFRGTESVIVGWRGRPGSRGTTGWTEVFPGAASRAGGNLGWAAGFVGVKTRHLSHDWPS